MSTMRAGIAGAVVIGGTALFGKYVMPAEKPFSEYNQAEFRLLEKHDIEEPKNWIRGNEAKRLMSEFDVNQDGILAGEEQQKAVNLLANLWKERNFIPQTPLNVAMSRVELAKALYDMSPDRSNARKNLLEEVERLRQE